MVTIVVNVCGDRWLNPAEVWQALKEIDKEEPIELDLRSEGPSLGALGVLDVLQYFFDNQGRAPSTVSIVRWPNRGEKTPLQHDANGVSHFFHMCERYRHAPIAASADAKLFGLFVGRRTLSRCTMLYDCHRDHSQDFLFSLMPTRWTNNHWTHQNQIEVDLESLDDWSRHGFDKWWQNCPIPSIDGHAIYDQYDDNCNTNLDLLAHYDKFHIEVVAETYTLGDTFFPTEKTIRPIMGGKPFMVYGPRFFLSRLKDLGFTTFESLIDESYDLMQGPDRWDAMKKEIQRLCRERPLDSIGKTLAICANNHSNLIDIMQKKIHLRK